MVWTTLVEFGQLLAIVLIILGSFFLALRFHDDSIENKGLPILIFGVLVLVSTIILSPIAKDNDREDFATRYDGYIYYVDGNEVKSENIDVLEYEYSIDNDEKKIVLTQKPKSSSFIFVPMIY